jgi:hypothetical protein
MTRRQAADGRRQSTATRGTATRGKAAKAAATKASASKATPAKAKPRKLYKAELKTKVNDAPVAKFLASVADAGQRADSEVLHAMFGAATKKPAKMWGSAIVGYGDYHYVGKSGREGDWFTCGFSPRKGNLTLYMLGGWGHDAALLKALGKHKLGGGCLYVTKLDYIDRGVLKKLIAASLKRAKKINTNYMEREA